jgi:hypothetical protein
MVRPMKGEGSYDRHNEYQMRAGLLHFTQRYRENGDAAAFAEGFMGFLRAFSEPNLREGLGLDENAVEELYTQLASRIEATAAEFFFEVHALTMLIRRID